MTDKEIIEETQLRRERHSVGCYFCGLDLDERDAEDADDYNEGDGGYICSDCARERKG